MTFSITRTSNQRSFLLVRLMVGAIFLPEGIQKFLFAGKLGAGRFAKIGWPNPGFSGPFVGRVENICGPLVLIGLITITAAIPLIIIMLVAMADTKAEVLANEGFWPMLHGSRTNWALLPGSPFLLIKEGGLWSVDYQVQKT